MSVLIADLPSQRVHRTRCVRCCEPVLEVPLKGGELTILVEAAEVTILQPCPTCRSGRQRAPKDTPPSGDSYFTRDLPCSRCGAKPGVQGWIGELLTMPGAAVDEDGYARVFLPGATERLAGEAVHRAHRCS